ncbi:unnamed protein product [Menidia menidia]|uniref:(Atlantic silverside) hypothetical protein n=1 Tax=Menidia menidia TaxID=238744 RepID=A0A8S4ADB7_9TELE|nr:unnamed protein product [Menidia menidia]CAG5866978.1 unnamed protein product [Menidia menidia]
MWAVCSASGSGWGRVLVRVSVSARAPRSLSLREHAEDRTAREPPRSSMSERFDCGGCSESLFGRTYIQVGGRPHCVACYDRLHASTCHHCREAIGHDAQELLYQDRHFHLQCFRCSRCRRSLADQPISCQDDQLLCSICSQAQCVACSRSVPPGSRMLKYEGSTWHEDCFLCRGCQKPIGAAAFVPDQDGFYCQPCHEDRLPRCGLCRKALTRGGVAYQDQVWHRDCFLCWGCRAPLAGQPFVPQGGGPEGGGAEGGGPEGGRPHCVRCFGRLYGQRCSGCRAAITGFGDSSYVSFQDLRWHRPCFKCSGCSVSLVGCSFYPDRDRILCRDCHQDQDRGRDQDQD